MVEKKNNTKPFVTSRTFDEPRDLVWKAWTERDRLMQWFGPTGFTMSRATLDFRPGGVFHYCLRTPDGKDMWGKFVYREIVPPERLVWVHSFSDEKGGLTRHPMSPTWPLESVSDLVQTTWERALRQIDRFQGGADEAQTAPMFRAWLSQILRNVHRNEYRDRQAARRRPPGGVLPLATAESEPHRDVAGNDPTASHAAATCETAFSMRAVKNSSASWRSESP